MNRTASAPSSARLRPTADVSIVVAGSKVLQHERVGRHDLVDELVDGTQQLGHPQPSGGHAVQLPGDSLSPKITPHTAIIAPDRRADHPTSLGGDRFPEPWDRRCPTRPRIVSVDPPQCSADSERTSR